MSLAEALENNRNKLDLEFSQEIARVYGDVKIMIPIDYAEDAYNEISEEVTDFSPQFFQTFIKRGMNNIASLKAKNTQTFLITAHAINALRDMYNQYERHAPPWLPETFSVATKSSTHQRAFYFDWSTVNPCHIPYSMESYLIMKLTDQLNDSNAAVNKSATVNTKSSITTNDLKPTISKPAGAVIESHSIHKPLSSDAEHGRFVAKKYLWLMDSASKRGHEFSITIEELSALLKSKTCYYTDVELVSYPHEKGDNADHLPDNYLTIDRKDNSRGYVNGNVVVCSKEINKLKDQMSESEFKQAVALKTLLSQSNLNPDQLHAFTAMMKGQS